MFLDTVTPLVEGHVLIKDLESGRILVNKRNKINLIYEKNPMGTAGCISMINDDFSNLVVINKYNGNAPCWWLPRLLRIIGQ